MARPRSIVIDAEWLKIQYINLNRSTTDIAKELHCSSTSVGRRLKETGIGIKSRSDAHKGHTFTDESREKIRQSLLGRGKLFIEWEWLWQQYSIQQKSDKRIALELGCSATVIRKRRKEFGIPTQPDRIKEYKRIKKTCEYCGIEFEDYPSNNPKFCSKNCYSKFMEENIERVCKSCGKHFFTKPREIKRRGAKYCSPECMKGENSPAWKGGISFEPYCIKFNNKFKENIRDKFGRKCFLCGVIENKIHHAVHHIDYNKNSICNGKEWAFVALCTKHHTKTNWNRWYWFNLLICYWAMNTEINFNSEGLYYDQRFRKNTPEGENLASGGRKN